MKVLGVVPARGGSVGIPRKNLRPLLGRPLLWYTAECARRARSMTRVVLTTDDEEIASVGRSAGLEVPFLRPAELARDDTPSLPVVQHAVRFLEEEGDLFDAVCLLQPTSPLREPSDVDRAVALLTRTGADSVISFVEVGEKHPARMKIVEPDGRVSDPPFAEATEGMRRQDLPKLYLRDGSIYLTRREVLMEKGSFKGDDCRALLVPVERSVNVDTPWDLFLAEQALRHREKHPD
jgi:CMP-N-acetylneuraminic acid synthetase